MAKKNDKDFMADLSAINNKRKTIDELDEEIIDETVEHLEDVIDDSEDNSFVIFVGEPNKNRKKPVQLLVDPELLERVDKLAKQTKKSRNEVISMMMEDCLNRVKIKRYK